MGEVETTRKGTALSLLRALSVAPGPSLALLTLQEDRGSPPPLSRALAGTCSAGVTFTFPFLLPFDLS